MTQGESPDPPGICVVGEITGSESSASTSAFILGEQPASIISKTATDTDHRAERLATPFRIMASPSLLLCISTESDQTAPFQGNLPDSPKGAQYAFPLRFYGFPHSPIPPAKVFALTTRRFPNANANSRRRLRQRRDTSDPEPTRTAKTQLRATAKTYRGSFRRKTIIAASEPDWLHAYGLFRSP